MLSEWPVGRFYSLEAMEVMTMKPMPDQKRVYPAPYSWGLPSPGKRNSLRAAMSTLNLDSSCTIRAERSQVDCCELHQAWFWCSSIRLSVFLHPWWWFRTFRVLMCLDRLRRCPVTVASQLGGEWRISVKPPFLGPTPRGANSAVSKESCWVVQGAAGSCCRFMSTSDD